MLMHRREHHTCASQLPTHGCMQKSQRHSQHHTHLQHARVPVSMSCIAAAAAAAPAAAAAAPAAAAALCPPVLWPPAAGPAQSAAVCGCGRCAARAPPAAPAASAAVCALSRRAMRLFRRFMPSVEGRVLGATRRRVLGATRRALLAVGGRSAALRRTRIHKSLDAHEYMFPRAHHAWTLCRAASEAHRFEARSVWAPSTYRGSQAFHAGQGACLASGECGQRQGLWRKKSGYSSFLKRAHLASGATAARLCAAQASHATYT